MCPGEMAILICLYTPVYSSENRHVFPCCGCTGREQGETGGAGRPQRSTAGSIHYQRTERNDTAP